MDRAVSARAAAADSTGRSAGRSGVGGRRTAGGANDEQRAFVEDDDARRRCPASASCAAPGVSGDRGVGAELGGGARRAVLRRLQLARQIVVLEGRRDEEEGVDRHPEQRQAPRETTASSSCHLHRLYAAARRRSAAQAQRPTTSLNRAATPPRSLSPACCETPPVPEDARNVAVLHVDRERRSSGDSRNSAPPFSDEPGMSGVDVVSRRRQTRTFPGTPYDPKPAATYGRTRGSWRRRKR